MDTEVAFGFLFHSLVTLGTTSRILFMAFELLLDVGIAGYGVDH